MIGAGEWEQFAGIARNGIPRRAVLGGGAAAALTVLTGCDSVSDPVPSDSTALVPLPDHLPFTEVSPDLESSTPQVSRGFLTYPTHRVAVHSDPPGDGGRVTAMCRINQAAPPRLEQNRYWQELNSRLNADLRLDVNPDYETKLQVALSGGEMPDLVQIPHRQVPNLPSLLETSFTDISEFVSGSNIEQYPSLANIPTASWQSARYGGRIYGVPIPRPASGTVMLLRQDIVAELGIDSLPDTPDDYLEFCRQLTDPASQRWALGDLLGVMTFVFEMFRVPNMWDETGGRFTSAYEGEEMERALEYLAKLWSAEVMHPDILSAAGTAQNTWFSNGTVVMKPGTMGFWTNVKTGLANLGTEEVRITAVPTIGADGEPGRKHLGSPTFSITAINADSADKAPMLLRILDWFASPFGSEENRFLDYGMDGVHFTVEDGNPVRTRQGADEVATTRPRYLGQWPPVLYVPGSPDDVRAQFEYESLVIPEGVGNPTEGLFSSTDVSQSASLSAIMEDTQKEVIQGRKSLDDWRAAVAEWRNRGGDSIRAEYEHSYEQQQ